MGFESSLVLWVFTDECCHPNRFRVELMLIESFEIGRLDFPNRDTLKSTHCFCLDLMADGPHCVLSSRVENGGVVAVHCNAGCPGGQSRKNVLARGGVCVLIHHVNANKQ